jgi:DNA-binding NarL/FixJ family response regulator
MLDFPLSPEALQNLRGSISELGDRNGNGIPHAGLVQLGELAAQGCEIAIDFDSVEQLGHPIVVLQPNRQAPNWFTALTPREREIARLVGTGLANKEIAAKLSITLGTVKDHLHRIFEKTALPNRAAIAAGMDSW